MHDIQGQGVAVHGAVLGKGNKTQQLGLQQLPEKARDPEPSEPHPVWNPHRTPDVPPHQSSTLWKCQLQPSQWTQGRSKMLILPTASNYSAPPGWGEMLWVLPPNNAICHLLCCDPFVPLLVPISIPTSSRGTGSPLNRMGLRRLLSTEDLRFHQRQPREWGGRALTPHPTTFTRFEVFRVWLGGAGNKNRNKNQRSRQGMKQLPARKLKFDIIWLSRAA